MERGVLTNGHEAPLYTIEEHLNSSLIFLLRAPVPGVNGTFKRSRSGLQVVDLGTKKSLERLCKGLRKNKKQQQMQQQQNHKEQQKQQQQQQQQQKKQQMQRQEQQEQQQQMQQHERQQTQQQQQQQQETKQ
ncbi:ataxin-8-like [Rhipicephalus sanguineus]|uniref:ataxin-8-like n=1 Tax=Rhipicephalus sanguineus TaxID=34632 RepID=UPI0020C2EFB6|nr:ataxin-8-like [Rhipicephalus sanguineus]